MITRRVTFRLYPTKAQTAKLFEWRRLHAYVYNSAITDRKENYQRLGKSINYYDQQNCLPAFKQTWGEYKELGSHALQAILKRVDMAFQRFFKKLGGYPRFKSIRRYSGWTYPDHQSWKVHTSGDNGYLELTNLGSIQMRGKARTWARRFGGKLPPESSLGTPTYLYPCLSQWQVVCIYHCRLSAS